MAWQPLPSTFEKARRREVYRRFARLVTGKDSRLLPFDEVKDRIRMFEQSYRGIRPIPVKNIVGSASRMSGFDKDFLPTRPELRQRWQSIERAFPQGGFPPIIVYKLGDSYFVVDGHHRVGIARVKRIDYIDAEITELRTDYEIPVGADIGRIIMAEQEQLFMRESGLARARPRARIEFTRAPGYLELLELVKLHGFNLMMERREVLNIEEITGDWYDRVYEPTADLIREEHLHDAFPDSTVTDVFLHIWQRRRAIFAERGATSLEGAVKTVSQEESTRLPVRARRTAQRLRDAAAEPARASDGPATGDPT